jgi:putative ABC transport system permease protein
MSMFFLALRNIIYRPLTTVLTLVLFATGLAIMNLLVSVGEQLDEKYTKNRAGVDMVVGAKGGRLQLILSSIYHIDNPVGNIKIGEAKFLFRDPRIDVIPLALGDNYEGYRIVGTDSSYIDLYSGEIAEGNAFDKPFEITAGSIVAERLGLKLGDQFAGVHGLGHEGHAHDDYKYTVTGILKPTGTVLDQLLLTGVQSVWEVHGEHDHAEHDHAEHETRDHSEHDHAEHDHAEQETGDHSEHDHAKHDPAEQETGDHSEHDHAEHDHAEQETGDHSEHDHAEHDPAEHENNTEVTDSVKNAEPEPAQNADIEKSSGRGRPGLKNHPLLAYPDQEITALLVKFKGSNAILLQQMVDENTDMMTALPELETQRLFSIIEPGVYYIKLLATLIVIISGFSVFISLLKSLNERRYEIALMRVTGATRLHIFVMIITEGLLLAIAGFFAAFLLSHAIMFSVASYLSETYHYDFNGWYISAKEINALYIALGIGFAAAIIPAIRAMMVNITKTLSKK